MKKPNRTILSQNTTNILMISKNITSKTNSLVHNKLPADLQRVSKIVDNLGAIMLYQKRAELLPKAMTDILRKVIKYIFFGIK